MENKKLYNIRKKKEWFTPVLKNLSVNKTNSGSIQGNVEDEGTYYS